MPIHPNSYTAVFVGGPRHGDVEEREGSPPMILAFPTFDLAAMEQDIASYERNELADTPGRIAYVFQPEEE